MRVVITSGGTQEPIDGVRAIANFSSGRTGSIIADYFARQGAEVIYLHAIDTVVAPREKVDSRIFFSFHDLDEALKKVLAESPVDVVIHLAAVSDFAVDTIQIGDKVYAGGEVDKIDSDDPITIKLKQNFKIIDYIKEYDSYKKLKLVGFKLTNTNLQENRDYAITRLLNRNVIDYLVHNDLTEIDKKRHVATIYNKHGEVLQKVENKEQLAESLYNLFGVEK